MNLYALLVRMQKVDLSITNATMKRTGVPSDGIDIQTPKRQERSLYNSVC